MKRLYLAVFITLMSCNTNNANSAVPARITDFGEQGRDELYAAVAQLLHQDSVSLAENAFRNSSVLVFERVPHRDARGNLIQGRELGMPTRIQLLLDNQTCQLQHMSTKEIIQLEQVKCRPE